jgi:hypothetical protein
MRFLLPAALHQPSDELTADWDYEGAMNERFARPRLNPPR